MSSINITIDGQQIAAKAGDSILQAALSAGVYIPHLCYHSDLPAANTTKPLDVVYRRTERIEKTEEGFFNGCGLCVVLVEGEEGFIQACHTLAVDGMVVTTQSTELKKHRQLKLGRILDNHPHACLTCAQNEGCSLTQCSSNVPEELRCCDQFARCELRKVAEHVEMPSDVKKYYPQNLPKITEEPLFCRDYNLCIGCTRCIRACADAHGNAALGYVMTNDGIIVGAFGPSMAESGCRFCGACVEVCPTGALADKDIKWTNRKAELVPCKHECPIGLDIPEYARYIAQEDFAGAAKVIRAITPLANVLGLVCFHPCEEVCRRGQVSEPIAICALKRFAIENSQEKFEHTFAKPTGKKVAVIGSGPAGLTAVYHLAAKGHDVTLFEANPKLGGMLRYGIPRYRLPEDVLDRGINSIVSNDRVTVRADTAIGDSIAFQKLKNDGFDAFLICAGAQKGKPLPAESGNLQSVRQGVEFLHTVAMGEIGKDHFTDKSVVVIGGGNVAIDAARTAIRLGATQVDIVCLESCDEMPAHAFEIEQAEEEGVKYHHSWGVKKIVATDGQTLDMELMECCAVFDDDGKFNPQFNNEKTDALKADEIIAAIGQEPNFDFLDDSGPALRVDKVIKVDKETMATSVQGMYAAGDAAHGPKSVVEAIASGMNAARAIDKLLGGDGVILCDTVKPAKIVAKGRIEGFAARKRESMPMIDLDARRKSFACLEKGFDRESSMAEARRCLGCDLRLQLQEPTLPPEPWLEFTKEAIETVPEAEGVFQLLDAEKKVLNITGCMNLRQELLEKLEDGSSACFFLFEQDPMYTKRESELIQQYMQEHGQMPGGGDDDLDDLF